ncbi:hypothetical protein NC652_025920 [Populus alba x Populus x berolinensis]|nr:hypothetical protein NC652_025920 [Populus alba x Populus x berolinensis]
MDTEESTSVMDDYETLISSTAQRQEKSAPEILQCTDDLGRHLDDTVLAKLPDNYQSTLKQSITSEEDDMELCTLQSHVVMSVVY